MVKEECREFTQREGTRETKGVGRGETVTEMGKCTGERITRLKCFRPLTIQGVLKAIPKTLIVDSSLSSVTKISQLFWAPICR